MSWWRHQMETSSALLALCAGNSPVTGAWINDWVNNLEAGDLRRHHANYYVTVMCSDLIINHNEKNFHRIWITSEASSVQWSPDCASVKRHSLYIRVKITLLYQTVTFGDGLKAGISNQPYELHDGLAHLSAFQETAIQRYTVALWDLTWWRYDMGTLSA